MFYSSEKSGWKNRSFSKINFHPMYFPRNAIMLQHLINNFRSIIYQVVTYGRLKTKEHFKHLALKVVAVTCERWSVKEVPNIVT